MSLQEQEPSVEVTVLFFAKARDLVGKTHETLAFPRRLSYSTLVKALIYQLPCLEVLQQSVVIAINEEYVDEREPVQLKAEDVIAVIPPISGG
ncbi:molybdopterin synthase sulfur carrier subunit-like [Watersipora subatra]|uniref:molybdopterin synthase sulfur carrier subunit-like n=1 Tax=Watersipora subatra TaxID=2589382 RepID=UPI00355C0A49